MVIGNELTHVELAADRIAAIAGVRGKPGRLTEFASRLNRLQAYEAVEGLASWSSWAAASESSRVPPQAAGVYMMRVRRRTIVYAGAVGERRLDGRVTGLAGALSDYLREKGVLSGFGEAALDRALADRAFVAAARSSSVGQDHPRVRDWARHAVAWHETELRWAVTPDWQTAALLQRAVTILLRRHGFWRLVE